MLKTEIILKHRKKLIFVLVFLLIITFFIYLNLGYYPTRFSQVFDFLTNKIPYDSPLSAVLSLRLRRALVAIFAGALMGVSGAVLQGTMRNPLASPFTLGIPQASALGVALVLIISSNMSFFLLQSPFILPLFAFLMALLQVFLIILLSRALGMSSGALILSAIALSFVYQAILSLSEYLFLNDLQVDIIVFWTFGDLSRAGWQQVYIIGISALILLPLFYYFSIDLDLIVLGDEIAESSGLDAKKFRLISTLLVALAEAVPTSFIGVIPFLGLVAPHLGRLIVGGSHKYLIPTSALVGSELLLVADLLGRIIIMPITIPVGIILSFIGTPILIILAVVRMGGNAKSLQR
ncbi:FecCD family ABC transporter permease [Acidianus ambivalens]|uniref:Iron chelate uptake ABC transporter family permease subunit n=1 Tax=Acidianus ambivalens TaxID=2283 RepID=A0A650CVR1_ACIAM|nr:iron ABC transporter permease [Acidianus ambivalens]MQL56526.1 iron chelate uptake ABC transporter family permease subunit [Acidianus ambivalens]QGR21949.1 iron chelate uptake ABC transporter family permease subunit [Acidianus ambivalens]